MSNLAYRIKDIESHPAGHKVHEAIERSLIQDILAGEQADLDECRAELDAELRMAAGTVLCRGALRGQIVLPCDRCLEPATLPIDVPLNMTFVPTSQALPSKPDVDDDEGDDPFDPDDIDYAHHDGEVIDLGPVVREGVLLSRPITSLCQADCRGLCPSCGVDRNRVPCTCRTDEKQSPFAVLRDLKL